MPKKPRTSKRPNAPKMPKVPNLPKLPRLQDLPKKPRFHRLPRIKKWDFSISSKFGSFWKNRWVSRKKDWALFKISKGGNFAIYKFAFQIVFISQKSFPVWLTGFFWQKNLETLNAEKNKLWWKRVRFRKKCIFIFLKALIKKWEDAKKIRWQLAVLFPRLSSLLEQGLDFLEAHAVFHFGVVEK